MDVQRLLQFCSWDSGLAEGAGMITAGKPNKGVEDEGWSEVTGAGAPEGEVKVRFEDTTCVKHDGFSDHWASIFFFQTRRQDYKLLPERRDLIGWITTGRHALQPHLCRPFQHLLPCIFLAVSFRKLIVIVIALSLLCSVLAVFWTIPPQIICLSTIIIVTSYLLLTGVLTLRFQSGWRNKRIQWCYFLIIQRLICIRGGGRSMK